MRRGTIVAAVTAGVLGAGGAGTAAAADLPISISFGEGTVKVGTFPVASAATAGTPATLAGTIDSTTLAAAFPQASVVLPPSTLDAVAFGAPYGTGKLVITPTAGDFTGSVNALTASLDLRGLVSYRLTATTSLGTYSCISDTPVPLQLAGSSLNPVTGAYAVGGEQISLTLRAPSLLDVPTVAFCSSQAQKVSPGAPVASTFAGTLSVPGVIPLPPSAPTTALPGLTPPATTGAPPAGTASAPQPGRLAVAVSKPKAVKRGRSTVTKVVVRNTGAGTARTVTVRLTAKGKGVTPRKVTKAYATIGAGRTRTFNVRLRSTKKAVKRSAVAVAVKGAGGLSASGTATLTLR